MISFISKFEDTNNFVKLEDDSPFFSNLEVNSHLFTYMNKTLKSLHVADREYQFFIQSASQLRSSSCFIIDKYLENSDLFDIYNY